jgi:hypothetical protein
MRLAVRIERIQTAIVWRLPRWVIRWAIVRAAVKGETGNPTAVTAETMVKRFLP